MTSKTLKESSVPTTPSTISVGCNSGQVMRLKRCQVPAPSMRAAS